MFIFNNAKHLGFWSQLCATQLTESKGVRPLLLISLGFSVVINVLLLAPSIYMLQVYDRVLTSRSLETLGMIFIMTMLTLIAIAVVEFARSALMTVVADAFDKSMQARVWEISLIEATGADQSKYNRTPANQSLRDITTIRGFLVSPAVFALFDAPWVLIYAGVIYLMHPALGILALVSAFLLLMLAALSDRALRTAMQSGTDSAIQQQRFQDSVHYSADLVVALHMTPTVAQHAQLLGRSARTAQLQTQLSSARFSALTKFTRLIVQIVMLGLAARVYLLDQATPGIMIAATVLLSRALSPAEQAISAWRQFIETKMAWSSISRLLQVQSNRAVYTQLSRPKGEIRFDQVSFVPSAGAPALLKSINLVVLAGQCIVIVGPSGSGKTTLTRLMAGLWKPSIGRVMLDGVDLAAWDPEQLANFVSYMPQQTDLLEGTVAQNIARFSAAPDDTVVKAALLAHVNSLIGQLPQAFDTSVGKASTYSLSGGQRQRIALARTVHGSPSVVILDEPNSSLDSDGEQALHECIKSLKKQGVTVLVVTQKINLFALADRVVVMKQGKIEAFSTPAELNANALSQRKMTIANPANLVSTT